MDTSILEEPAVSIFRVTYTLMTEVTRSSEMLMNVYQTTCSYSPEDSSVHCLRTLDLTSTQVSAN
jgi:hypothetical protein